MQSANVGVKTLRIRPTAAVAIEPVDDPHYVPSDPADLLHAVPTRRTNVRFSSNSAVLAGHLYRPPQRPAGERTPGIVMCGPFGSVKEQTLPHYAERFADAGYTVLAFDPRGFGESEGEPRYHFTPERIIEDLSNAVSALSMRDDIDPQRIAVVGVCMGGGYAVSVGARDKRIRTIVSIAGGYNIGDAFQSFMGVDGFAQYCRRINDLVMKQYQSGTVQYVPTTAPRLSEQVPVAGLPNEEAFSYYDRTSKTDAPNWSNQITAASLEAFFSYNAVVHAPLVAPAPLLIIHGTKDVTLPPEYAQQAYDAAIGPKELIWIETHNHIELYDHRPYVNAAAALTVEWLDRYLNA
jgi:fermentation-respiration switch protein FrsA (DUF1100 family)